MLNTRPDQRSNYAPKPFYTVCSYFVGIISLGLALFVISDLARAQERVRKDDDLVGKREKAAPAERERRDADELAEVQEQLGKRVKEIMAKADQGQEISPKEKEILGRFKAIQAQRADMLARRRKMQEDRRDEALQRTKLRKRDRFSEPFVLPPRLNAVDQAYYSASQILFRQEKYSDVVAELKNIVDRSPDKEAVSYTHFNIAGIYRTHIKDPEKAVEEYREVTGELIPLARNAIVMTYEEIGEVEKAIKELDIMLESAEDVAEKVRILNSTADIYERNGQPDDAIAALRRIPEMITYEEAMKVQKSYQGNAAESLERQILELTRGGRLEEAERLRKRFYDTFVKSRRRRTTVERKRYRREK